MSDDLFIPKAHLALCNYQLAVNEALTVVTTDPEATVERDALIMQAYIGQGNYQMVLDQITAQSPPAMQALQLLALYLKGDDQDSAMVSLQTWMSDTVSVIDPTARYVAGKIYLLRDDLNEALRCLDGGATLDIMALRAQIYLRMNRVDLAGEEVKNMCKIDEDNVLCQLVQAYVFLATGGNQVDQAYYVFTELSDKYGSPSTALVGTALCHMHSGKWVEAEPLLMEALVKTPNHPDALINLIACHYSLQRDADARRYTQQLKTQCPNHIFVTKLESLDAAFDTAAASRAQMA